MQLWNQLKATVKSTRLCRALSLDDDDTESENDNEEREEEEAPRRLMIEVRRERGVKKEWEDEDSIFAI